MSTISSFKLHFDKFSFAFAFPACLLFPVLVILFLNSTSTLEGSVKLLDSHDPIHCVKILCR